MIPLTRYKYHTSSLAFGQNIATWSCLATHRAGKCKLDYRRLCAWLKIGFPITKAEAERDTEEQPEVSDTLCSLWHHHKTLCASALSLKMG